MIQKLVVLLLVPCLAVDPSLSHAAMSVDFGIGLQTYHVLVSSLFTEEAIIESSYSSDQPSWPIHGIKHRAIEDLHFNRRDLFRATVAGGAVVATTLTGGFLGFSTAESAQPQDKTSPSSADYQNTLKQTQAAIQQLADPDSKVRQA